MKRVWTEEQKARKNFLDRERYRRNREKVLAESRDKYAASEDLRNRKVNNSRSRYRDNKDRIRESIKERRLHDTDFRMRDLEHSKKWREENKEAANAISKRWTKENPEKRREILKKYRDRNKDKVIASRKKWREENKEKSDQIGRNAARARKSYIKRAFIYKSESRAIFQIYEECRKLNEYCEGEKYHVDHILPLRGRRVSGLHCVSNLRIIEASKNITKSNHWDGDLL